MWAGGELTFHAPLLLGTTVSRRSTIHSIIPRRGQSGDLVFVNVRHEVRLADELCLEEEQTIVYRLDRAGAVAPAPVAASTPAPALEDRTATVAWRLDNTAVFRYSALTFNGHRIHYDADYCREVEGYPDIVVQGPLIATLLLDLAVREGRTLGRFTYRAVHPLFLPHAFTVNASVDGDATNLWAADHNGGLVMRAELLGTAPTTL
jgi:3-methylfumaryl-CoA hydratase